MSVEDIYAQLSFSDPGGQVSFTSTKQQDAPYEFHLNLKSLDFGDYQIYQFWMPIPTLYGQRSQRATNQDPLVDAWWEICGRHQAQGEVGTMETYWLAKILPYARSNGSRQVFQDAFDLRQNISQRQRAVEDLNQLLARQRLNRMTETEFHKQTDVLLGKPNYPNDTWECYHEICNQLFASEQNTREPADGERLAAVLERWGKLMKNIGRHGGHETKKMVLNILSYECRAAFHRCYSAIWTILLNELYTQYGLTEQFYVFHELWHLDRAQESNLGDQARFHPFHGHIFGLHPASGPLLLTEVGRKLVGRWLQSGSMADYEQVLSAIYLAVYHYSGRHELLRDSRRSPSKRLNLNTHDVEEHRSS